MCNNLIAHCTHITPYCTPYYILHHIVCYSTILHNEYFIISNYQNKYVRPPLKCAIWCYCTLYAPICNYMVKSENIEFFFYVRPPIKCAIWCYCTLYAPICTYMVKAVYYLNWTTLNVGGRPTNRKVFFFF